MVASPFKKFAASILTVALAGAGLMAQEQPKEKKVKDQAEYDLLMAVNKETQPPKKIELLNQWKEKYPDSDYKEDRAQLLCQTWQQAGDARKMWDACEDLHKLAPKNFLALFFLTSLTLSMNDTSPERLAKGEEFATKFLAMLPDIFNPAKKPAQATEEQFKKERMNQEALGRKTLGFVATSRKDYVKAEQIYTDYLKNDPSSGNISYALGNAILLQKNKEKQIPALWHLARAAYYTGPDALPDASKKQLQTFFEKTYINYHEGKDGMQEVIDKALKDPFPPADFTIESGAQRRHRIKNEIRESNPMLYLWLELKEGLTGPGGAEYWSGTLKGSGMPKLKGKVISAEPAARPNQIIVGVSDPNTPEIKLMLEAPVGKVDPGLEIEFEGGEAKDFTPDPFLLTVDQENAKVTGLPKAVGPAKAAPKAGKKAAKRK